MNGDRKIEEICRGLFPKYCICKNNTIKVSGKKQFPTSILTVNAETTMKKKLQNLEMTQI